MSTDKAFRQEEEDLTYGDIVWTQFRKNRVAFYSLLAVAMLFFLAIFCPLIASGRPFVWVENGETSFPWLISLFDRNYYENAIDVFFNLLLILGTPFLGVWLVRMRMLGKQEMSKRPRRRKLMREGGILFVLFMVIFAKILQLKNRLFHLCLRKLMLEARLWEPAAKRSVMTYFLILGSRASRRPSPTRFNKDTVIKMANPGAKIRCQVPLL